MVDRAVIEDIGDVVRRVAAANKNIEGLRAEARILAKQGKEVAVAVDTLTRQEVVFAEAAKLLQSFSEEQQASIIASIEKTVTYGLRLVFQDAFKSFKLNSSVSHGQMSLSPTVVFDVAGVQVTSDILSSHGGGPADVIGFILKLLLIVFKGDGKVRPILFLDESFAHLSEEYLPIAGQLIHKFVRELGQDLQIVLVSHQKEFVEYADKVYEFSKVNGATKVECLK